MKSRNCTIFVVALFALVATANQSQAQSQRYSWITIAGVAPSGADGTNSAARFNQPSGVAVDSGGNVYVADQWNHTIRKVIPVGTNWVSSTIAGLAGNPGSADGTNSDARFYYPVGVTVDSRSKVYVVDLNNSTIRKLTPVGTNWASSTIAGLAGNPGSADGTNSDARFNEPTFVAVDNGDNLYVAELGNSTIRKLTLVGTNWVSSTIAGLAGSSGSADGTNSDTRFNHPFGVAVDSGGDLYVADTGNNTIRKLAQEGTNWVSSTIAGLAGSSGSADGTNSDARFDVPIGAAVDGGGNIYVVDGNSTIRNLTLVGTNWVSSTVAGLAGSLGSADGTNTNARFNDPVGVAVDSASNLYVADTGNNTIRKLAQEGSNWVSSTIAGLPSGPGSADGTNTAARFSGPTSLAVDGAGNLYVADSTIRKLTPVGGNWVSSTIAGISGVLAVAVDTGDNVYAAVDLTLQDGAVSISKLTLAGTNWVSSAIGTVLGEGLAVDSAGDVYVPGDTKFNTIAKFTPIGTNWVSSAIGAVSGEGLAVDNGGSIYVAGDTTISKLTLVGTKHSVLSNAA
jgi:hypothetical protein